MSLRTSKSIRTALSFLPSSAFFCLSCFSFLDSSYSSYYIFDSFIVTDSSFSPFICSKSCISSSCFFIKFYFSVCIFIIYSSRFLHLATNCSNCSILGVDCSSNLFYMSWKSSRMVFKLALVFLYSSRVAYSFFILSVMISRFRPSYSFSWYSSTFAKFSLVFVSFSLYTVF